jgi:hypothetical protein
VGNHLWFETVPTMHDWRLERVGHLPEFDRWKPIDFSRDKEQHQIYDYNSQFLRIPTLET